MNNNNGELRHICNSAIWKEKKNALLIILITKFVTGWFCFNCFSFFIVNWRILYTVYYSSACTIFINLNHCIPFEKLNCKPQGTRSSDSNPRIYGNAHFVWINFRGRLDVDTFSLLLWKCNFISVYGA